MPEPDHTRERTRDAVAAMLVGVTLNAVAVLLAARGLGAAGRGTMVVMTLVPTAINVLAGGGLAVANVHCVARGVVTPRAAVGNTAAWSVLVPTGLAGLAWATGVAQWAGPVVGLTAEQFGTALWTSSAVMLYQQMNAVFQGVGDFRAVLYGRAVQGVGVCALVLGALALSANPVICFFAWVGSFLLASALYLVMAVRRGWVPVPSFLALRSSLRYGLRGMWAQVWDMVNFRADQFFVAAVAPPAVLGVYSVGAALSELLFHVPTAVSQVVFTESSMHSDQNRERAVAESAGMAVVLVGLAAVGVTGLSVVVPFVIGAEYADVPYVVVLLAVSTTLLASARLMGAHVMGAGRPDVPGWAAACSLAVTLAFDSVLIPTFGALGAALGSALGYLSASIILAWMFSRLTSVAVGSSVLRGVRNAIPRARTWFQ